MHSFVIVTFNTLSWRRLTQQARRTHIAMVCILPITAAVVACSDTGSPAVTLSGAVPTLAPDWNDREVLRLGEILGSEQPAFGDIASAAVTANGDIYVLDRNAVSLLRFDAAGTRVAETDGRSLLGEPFVHPTDIHLPGVNRVSVLDGQARQIVTLSIDKDKVALHSRVTISGGAGGFCRLGNRWYVLLPRHEYPIHVFDDQSRLVDSLAVRGPRVHSEGGRAVYWPWHSGWLLCDPTRQQILFVSQYLSEVISLAPSSQEEERWRTTIEGYNARRWEITRAGTGVAVSSYLTPASVSAHETSFAVIVDGDHAAITLRDQTGPGRYENTYEVRMLRLEDGTEVATYDSPGIVFGEKAGLVHVFRNRGHSEIVTYRQK